MGFKRYGFQAILKELRKDVQILFS